MAMPATKSIFGLKFESKDKEFLANEAYWLHVGVRTVLIPLIRIEDWGRYAQSCASSAS